jgi:hypothetical protein
MRSWSSTEIWVTGIKGPDVKLGLICCRPVQVTVEASTRRQNMQNFVLGILNIEEEGLEVHTRS